MRHLKLVPEETAIPFMSGRKIAAVLSGALIVASIVLFLVRGLNLGIDFAGGISLQFRPPQPVPTDFIRSRVAAMNLGDIKVQDFGSADDFMIQVERQPNDEESGLTDAQVQQGVITQIQDDLSSQIPGLIELGTATVGGKVSGELVFDGILAVTFAIMAVLIYIWFRFEWQFGLGAIMALVHDVILTIGFFSLTQLEFNLSILAAILTIVGYSLNDTVVVFDRIREILTKFRSMEMIDLLNLSINKTLSRTLMTSVTTLVALFSLFFLGGPVIQGFTAAMIWGVFVGTYSSVFIAAPVLASLNLQRSSFELVDKSV